MSLSKDKSNQFPSNQNLLLPSQFKNTLLKALDADVIARLRLLPVTFELEHEIESPGNPIAYLFFVEEGMASMTTTFENGSQVEVGMFGYESVIGVSALMGTKRSLNRVLHADCGLRILLSGGSSEEGIPARWGVSGARAPVCPGTAGPGDSVGGL